MNKKFRDFIDSMLPILAVIGLATWVIAIAVSAKPEAQQKEPINKPAQEHEILNDDIDEAYAYLKEPLDESFNDTRHEITKDGDTITLHFHISIKDMQYTTQEEWQELKNNAIYAQSIWQKALELEGYSAKFAICIGDLDQGILYLTIMDGKVIFDGVSEIEYQSM